MSANCLQLNTAKTEVIWFATRHRQTQLATCGLRFGDDVIQPVKAVRELGCFVDSDVGMYRVVSLPCVSFAQSTAPYLMMSSGR